MTTITKINVRRSEREFKTYANADPNADLVFIVNDLGCEIVLWTKDKDGNTVRNLLAHFPLGAYLWVEYAGNSAPPPESPSEQGEAIEKPRDEETDEFTKAELADRGEAPPPDYNTLKPGSPIDTAEKKPKKKTAKKKTKAKPKKKAAKKPAKKKAVKAPESEIVDPLEGKGIDL